MDLEEALVTLWDAGFDDLETGDDVIPAKRANSARTALHIVPTRAQTRIDYWLKSLNITREEFSAELAEIGVELSPRARTLPKGALRKLKRRYLLKPASPDAPHEPLNPCPPFEWATVGKECQITHLSRKDVLAVHDALVRDFAASDDPISPPGVRDENLLISAIERPQTSLGDQRKYPSAEMAGAALLHSIVMNHAFSNGNKRTGLVCLLTFLDKNSILPTCTEDDLFKLTLRLAQHRLVEQHCDQLADREVLEVANWILGNSRSISKGDRPMSWLKLKRILRDFGCSYETAPGKGSRLNIYRTLASESWVKRHRTRKLSIQVAYGGDGTEVERNTVNYVRTNLMLDENHGIDSKVFYEAESEPDDFIQEYRTLLRRLARL